MRPRPLLALATGFAVGAALPGAPGRILGATVAAASALASLSPPLAPIAAAGAGWLAAAAARSAAATARRPGAEPAILEGRIASVPERLEGRVRFALQTPQDRLLVTAPDLPWPLALGDRVRLQARLRAPEGARNPGGRDRAADLAARGIALEAHAALPPIRVAPPSPLARLEAARLRFGEAAAAALPPRESALVRAVGAGDRSAVDPATAEAFARSGLAHLLSVSGLHLAVVAFGASRALRAVLARLPPVADRVDPRRAAAAAALPLTALYALATGADVPVMRSALGAAAAFAGVLLDRELGALDALGLAALAVLASDPGALRDPSFQLSFTSVAGLALAAGPLRRALPIPPPATRLGRLREALLGATCASLAATLATAPIVAYHFRRVSLLAVAANLAGVPIGSALTVVAAAAAVAGAVSPAAAAPLLLACRPLATALLFVNDVCAAPSWAVVGLGSPGLLGALACEAALLAALRLDGWRRPLALAVAAAALLAAPPLRRALAIWRGGLEVLVLGVGQGDATALLLPDGAAVLVDGGGEATGRYDPGARDVVPFLRDAGVRRVPAVFLSHPHPDHLLGLPAVAEAFGPTRLFTNGRAGDGAIAPAWAHLPAPTRLAPGDAVEIAGVRLEVLGPPEESAGWGENDASLVLRASYGAVAFLLCGDVERLGEAALLRRPDLLRADVVKVPHHGSLTSSGPALVAATRPAYAVATAGRDNRFGFPAPAVVGRWESAGARVRSTAGGAIRFLTDGRTLREVDAAAALDPLALARERP